MVDCIPKVWAQFAFLVWFLCGRWFGIASTYTGIRKKRAMTSAYVMIVMDIIFTLIMLSRGGVCR